MTTAYIALGSNIEPKLEYLAGAIRSLDKHEEINLVKQSSVYDTAPVGYLDQDNFLNMVLEVETGLDSESLLDVCQAIERDLKRVRQFKNGPRTIDVDILMYGDEVIRTQRLDIPHPRMHERAFVMVPLAEIASSAIVHSLDQPVADLVDGLPAAEKVGVIKKGCLADLIGA